MNLRSRRLRPVYILAYYYIHVSVLFTLPRVIFRDIFVYFSFFLAVLSLIVGRVRLLRFAVHLATCNQTTINNCTCATHFHRNRNFATKCTACSTTCGLAVHLGMKSSWTVFDLEDQGRI